jgi:hypothetical protein
MVKKNKIVTLSITSYRGWGFGMHYYGHLKYSDESGGEDIEVRHKLTAKQASALNRYDSARTYKAGGMDYRFDTIEEVEVWALKLFKEEFKDSLLYKGTFASASAQPLLSWPKWFDKQAKRMNKLAEERERIGGYEKNPKRTTVIDDEWWDLLQTFKKK